MVIIERRTDEQGHREGHVEVRRRSRSRSGSQPGRAVAGPAPSTAAARPRCRLLSAQADRVAVHVGEHADPRLWCDLTRGVALVEILDVGKGHRPPAFTGWIEADLEAVDVVADVVRL